jgi:heme exporter protein A
VIDALHLKATSLAYRVGRRALLNDVSIEVKAGAWVQVTGANGVGKSTLLRMLAGLTQPDSGSIERKDGAARLLYQGHMHGFKDAFTVLENLCLQAELDASGFDFGQPATHLIKTGVLQAIETVGLAQRTDLAFGKLSAGQKRRCMLARLALCNGALKSTKLIWLLDEPLTALDTDAQALMATIVNQHLQQGGSAVIATHHDLTLLGLPQPTELRL